MTHLILFQLLIILLNYLHLKRDFDLPMSNLIISDQLIAAATILRQTMINSNHPYYLKIITYF